MIPFEIKPISPTHELHVINIESLDSNTTQHLDDFLVSICEGDSGSELELVKKRLKKFLEDKDTNTRMGAAAELFAHLYLNISGYKQEFLFFNLEEGSIKKGFDGFFSKDSNTYILESKSGSISSQKVSHKEKLKHAYSDLNKYVSGKSDKGKNNPWKNAYNHASHVDVGTEKSIRKKIKSLQDMFDLGTFSKISEFNVITCSTIFLNGAWDAKKSSEILSDNNFISDFDGKTIKAMCLTKSSLNNFIDYLGK
ncbi:hypothetical protein I5G24_15500 [Pseudomonas aeruginosa]|uniref:Anti-bacteriophage protein A/HamA C-terminal domain-containing protein n=1 Tax=Stutzerimonas stutzeri (strain A1501) TaxID=379731 RepID=A4VH82_STUS1|nr:MULTISPECIES: hypothetical protein [Pseudomonadaceae]SAJ30837.1 Uncharacterised protein [Enterobacter cloacae]ABP78333.1 conserved hypothetical protein [Stutzerimonas stutzeri A1501]ELQ8316617.1 hypothetical protein [Pseudomonas aeruginosa]MBG6795697.1 hypothetical protein [Pseudomonas aeruginosa]MBG6799214.1 hypothetical protein [Pseudomonas aeruginosa]